MGQMKNQLRVRKDQPHQSTSSTAASQMGGREFGQVIEPMQSQLASGNEGLADSSAGQEKKKPRKGKKAA